jgi:sec-independent protein translocase protein TatA
VVAATAAAATTKRTDNERNLMPGFIGFPELLLLGLLALILFGPKRLPEMGRGLGKGMREFKESITGDSPAHTLDVAKLEIPADAYERTGEKIDREAA